MKVIRWLLGGIVLFINYITWPKAGVRSEEHQSDVDEAVQYYSLYQFRACPFCVKVRRAMRRLNLPVEVRDAKVQGTHRVDLQQQGGKVKVPCLRVDYKDGSSKWMYESDDIIAFLTKQFPLKNN